MGHGRVRARLAHCLLLASVHCRLLDDGLQFFFDSDPQLALRRLQEVLLSLLQANPDASVVSHGTPATDCKSMISCWSFSASRLTKRALSNPLFRELQMFVGLVRFANLDGSALHGFTSARCAVLRKMPLAAEPHCTESCHVLVGRLATSSPSMACQHPSRTCLHSAFPDQASKQELAPRLCSHPLQQDFWHTRAWECAQG